MIVELGGRLTTFKKAEPGALIRFASSSTEYLAIKVWTEKQEAPVLLKPGHDAWKGRPGIRYSRWDVDEPVFEISDTIFRPNVEDLELADGRLADPGHFVIDKDGRSFLVVGATPAPDVIAFVDVATGEVVSPLRTHAVFKRWSIVRLVDDRPLTLMEFGSPPTAKPVAV